LNILKICVILIKLFKKPVFRPLVKLFKKWFFHLGGNRIPAGSLAGIFD